jgi:hypothetical protein
MDNTTLSPHRKCHTFCASDVPNEILGGLEGDEPPRGLIMEQHRKIAEQGGRPAQDCRTAMKDAVTPAGPPSWGLARRTDPTSD